MSAMGACWRFTMKQFRETVQSNIRMSTVGVVLHQKVRSDLLAPDNTNLQIREDSAHRTYAENLSSHREEGPLNQAEVHAAPNTQPQDWDASAPQRQAAEAQ